jgi:hypothetical protein
MERSEIEDGGMKSVVFACVESSISFHCIEATLAYIDYRKGLGL